MADPKITVPKDSELQTLASIYTQLSESDRNILLMGSNLLLASQEAKKHRSRKVVRKPS